MASGLQIFYLMHEMTDERTIDQDRFGGIVRLYGARPANAFANAHVCVIGIGGVGSWTVESLVRSGVGRLTLIDLDEICVTNTNRQIHTTSTTVGRGKAAEMCQRGVDIAPDVRVEVVEDFVDAENVRELITTDMDVVVDAIDAFREKVAVIERCAELDVPVVVAGAAGGRSDATQIQVADLNRTAHDPLLRRVRKELRRGVYKQRADRLWQIPAVFSSERARSPTPDGCTSSKPAAPGAAMDCGTGMGTATHVTGTFGFLLAGAAMDLLVASSNE